MRSHKALVILGVAVMACTALAFWGCGDDNNSTNWGSPTDPAFIEVDAQVGEFIDSTLTWFSDGLGSIASLPTDGNVDPVQYGPGDPGATTDSLSVAYNGGWHVIHLEYHAANGYAAWVHDSVQFVVDGQPSQQPDSLDQLQYRHRWSWTAPDTTVTFRDLNGHNAFSYAGLQTNQATVNGSNTVMSRSKYVSQDSVVSRNITVEGTLNNFKIDKTPSGWAQGCPASGSATATATMTYQKDDGAPVISTWTFTLSFNHGMVSATAESNGRTWNYTRRECYAPTSD
ncbi:MAG: hypothetical protein KKB37_17460 [Alphaproteobacteria bacterium]|nr:hypothetical protein [Alphaproteobacteria bacterium]